MTAPFSVSPAKPQILKKSAVFLCPKAEGGDSYGHFTSGSDRAFEQLAAEAGSRSLDSGDAGAPEDCGRLPFYPHTGNISFVFTQNVPYQPDELHRP